MISWDPPFSWGGGARAPGGGGGGGGPGGHETDSKIHPISTGKSHPPPEAESPWYIAGGMCVPKKTNLGETGLWIT